MTILIAPDSFKNCLPAIEVCRALCSGIKSVERKVKVILFPMADGGEGTTEILNYHISGRWQILEVGDALGRRVTSRYLLLNDRDAAVIELAKASGLELLHQNERDPLKTSTFGTGELIRHALDNGVEEIILTIGGSATVDGGTGIASALGFSFYNNTGNEFVPTGGTLKNIYRIDKSRIHPKFSTIRWLIASDVQNVLNGPEGAARIYGPQKGADEKSVEELAAGLEHLAKIIERDTGFKTDDHEGTGAAGGAALFLMAYANAELESGFDIISGLTNFERAIEKASLIITGEGKIDAQTKYGKVVSSIARQGTSKGIPVIVVGGATDDNPELTKNSLGLSDIFTIFSRALNHHDSISRAYSYLEEIGIDIAKKYVKNKY